MADFGIELVQEVWCVYKMQDNRTLWLDSKKQWTRENQKRAGIKDFEKAKQILIKVTKGEL